MHSRKTFGPNDLRARVVADIDAGNVVGFLALAENTNSLKLAYFNLDAVKARGLYEPTLLHAFTATRTNHHVWPTPALQFYLRRRIAGGYVTRGTASWGLVPL